MRIAHTGFGAAGCDARGGYNGDRTGGQRVPRSTAFCLLFAAIRQPPAGRICLPARDLQIILVGRHVAVYGVFWLSMRGTHSTGPRLPMAIHHSHPQDQGSTAMARSNSLRSMLRPVALIACLAAICLATMHEAHGQFVSQQVGGVSIDARGIVQKVKLDEVGELLRVRKAAFQPVPGDMKLSALRKVSLRQLEAAIAELRKSGTPLSDDMRYLAGLQRIQYVFVYPEQNDIVLAGPGEGWRISPEGEIVGETTNRPVMLLDDLMVALRRPRHYVSRALAARSIPRPKVWLVTRRCSRRSTRPPRTRRRSWMRSKRRWGRKRSPSRACPRRRTSPACWWRPIIG